MTNATPDTCAKNITRDGWHFTPCGRPVKRDGLCGIHAAARERATRNDERRRAVRAATHHAALERDRKAATVQALIEAHGEARARELLSPWVWPGAFTALRDRSVSADPETTS